MHDRAAARAGEIFRDEGVGAGRLTSDNRCMAEGLRFECQPGCTACCRQQGYVYLTESDIARAAGFLGLPRAGFEKKYVYRTRNLRRLRVPRAAHCPFLEETGCSIHPAKPVQCRIFPFWPELVDSRRRWRQTASYCPGIGKGPLIQIETAQVQAREMREAHPAMYK
ncbi:MAG TPA: YkgJ family cysteine cluster protein [Bryobacteraceae bacterium]|nr:YkgJ family cysteine cluster protein [Bryobacteraceae bacterium]